MSATGRLGKSAEGLGATGVAPKDAGTGDRLVLVRAVGVDAGVGVDADVGVILDAICIALAALLAAFTAECGAIATIVSTVKMVA